MWEVIGDKYMYLTYYVHLRRIKRSDGLQEMYGVESFKNISLTSSQSTPLFLILRRTNALLLLQT